MTLERGFRRLTMVGSVVILGLGLALDAMSLWPHATVQVTLKDGRKFTLERHEPRGLLTDRSSLTRALPEEALGPPELLYDAEALKKFRKSYPQYRDMPDLELARFIRDRPELNLKWKVTSGEFRRDPDIVEARVIRGPEYWWWTDTLWAKVTVVLVILAWTVFSVVRWIARGFVG